MPSGFVRFLAIVGAFALVLILISVISGVVGWLRTPGVPDRVILEVDLERPFLESAPADPLAQLALGRAATVRDVVEALERAAGDDRVVSLVARVGESGNGLATIQEIRDAVSLFRASGKRAVAFAETFGEVGPGNSSYYLATAFDEIHLQPSGDIGLTGIMMESPFIRGSLEKIGVEPRGDHRYEYKNALNLFTERAYTEPHREASEAIMNSWFGQIVGGIAKARGLTEEEVRAVVDSGPLLAEEAFESGLVDGLAYRDEVYAAVKETAGEAAELLYLSAYLQRAGRPHTEGETVALIYGVGGVVRGRSQFSPVSGQAVMGSDSVGAAFRDAVEDPEVKAILFRIDSPGGSYVASDVIWREVVRAQEAGKPVIASMSNVAGSGGYFVAMAADRIVAQPATITGSIGVVFTKFLTPGLWEKLGISWDEVHTSAHSRVWSGTHDYTPEEWARLQGWLDRVYEDFTQKVANGRDMPLEEVQAIAKGRIWSGEDALGLGLIDAVGGFPTSLRVTREVLELPEDAPLRLKLLPRPKTPLQLLAERFGGGGEENSEPVGSPLLAESLRTLRPLGRVARELGLLAEPGILRMPELGVR